MQAGSRNKKLKFGVGIAIILGVVAWEAVTGFQQSKTYYVTVSELIAGKTVHLTKSLPNSRNGKLKPQKSAVFIHKCRWSFVQSSLNHAPFRQRN